MGVRIFSDSRDPQSKEPLAVERRGARQTRRLLHRRKQRRRAAFRLLRAQGLFPESADGCRALKSLDPLALRAKALDSELERFELGRALFNLAVRRGFKSNRKDRGDGKADGARNDGDKLSQAQKISNLDAEIKKSGARTLGEWLAKTRRESGTRFAPGRMPFYPSRAMYETEFRAIEAKQKPFHPNVDWEAIHEAIFFQRPLRPVERGKCQYMRDRQRAFKALPCSQRLRILQEVRNLSFMGDGGKQVALTGDMQDEIIGLLRNSKQVKFDRMRKKLGLDERRAFSLEGLSRDHLNGDETAVVMRKDGMFGALWDALPLEEQDAIVETLIASDEDKEVMALLSKYNLTEAQKENVANAVFPAGTSAYCKEFSEALVHEMERSSENFTEAKNSVVKALGIEADDSVENLPLLPYYGKILTGSTIGAKSNPKNDEERFGKIANPTVHVALNQTRAVVNALIRRYGRPKQIVVELARELKESREGRALTMKRQAEGAKRNEADNKKIREGFKIERPGRDERLKFRLWNDQKFGAVGMGACVYCGRTIASGELFSGETHIDHILPYSRTLLDSESNKILCCAACNQRKGNNTPFEAFGGTAQWSEILERVARLENPAKRRAFTPEAIEKFEKDSGFIARQLTDNAYLSRMALRYLKSVCDDVWSANGGMTHLLRGKWGIDKILSRKIDDAVAARFNLDEKTAGGFRKNRQDHRHHALDAVVIACIDRSLVKEISTLNAHGSLDKITPPPMPVERKALESKVRAIVVSFKPEHGAQGKLSKETPLGFRSFTGCDGKTEKVYVARSPVVSLTEKNMASIVDVKIRRDVERFVAAHKGEKIEDALRRYSEESGVKKVRCKTKNQTPTAFGKGARMRYLDTNDYFAAIVWRVPPQKAGGEYSFKASYIRRTDVAGDGMTILNEGKPHPAAKKLGVVHKKDCLEFFEGGRLHMCRVEGFKKGKDPSGNRLDIRPIYATQDCAGWIISTQDRMLDRYWKPSEGHNYIAVNVLFGRLRARFITVDPIGRVTVKK